MQHNYKLLADAGSTKVDWVVISDNGTVEATYKSDGLNALIAEYEDVHNSLEKVKKELADFKEFDEIHYYGAGCATPRVCSKMQEALHEAWPSENIYVKSDLLAAARALFKDGSGIACILGTGSNSGLFRDGKIIKNIPSLGYILGDEGSGSALGKRLVADAFKGHLPNNIRQKFLEEFKFTLPMILDSVYRNPAPNKFLASLVTFISDHIWNPYIYGLVYEEFCSFFRRNIAMYPGSHRLPIGFIGSIAVNYEKILREAALDSGYKVAMILRSPIEGLVEFHSSTKF